MQFRASIWPLSAIVLLLCHQPLKAQPVSPQRIESRLLSVLPYASTGYVSTRIGRFEYSGSGAVARDRRLLYTCAHVLFDEGQWASRVGFHRAWHSVNEPADDDAVVARGYHYISGYAGRWTYPYDFDKDFAVAYSFPGEEFGTPLGTYEHGEASRNAVRSPLRKMILGYPAYLDYDFSDGYYYQHRTEFTGAFYQTAGPFYEIDGVSTGPGNSGGPALVEDGAEYRLAGVLVSGVTPDPRDPQDNYYNAGIYVLDANAELAAVSALGSSEQPFLNLPVSGGSTVTASAAKPRDIPDGKAKFISRKLRVPKKNVGASTTQVMLDLQVNAGRRGDLDVFLRSPRGRVYVVATADPSLLEPDLRLQNEDISSSFSGSNPRGTWRFFLRDGWAGETSRVIQAALHITTR